MLSSLVNFPLYILLRDLLVHVIICHCDKWLPQHFTYIYSVDTTLYPYALPLIYISYSFSSLCLSCNLSSSLRLLHYWSYIQTDSIGDTQGFSGKTPITPSGGFSVETLTGVTLLWKTELNRSISTVEDGIPKWLQHYYKMCCKKGGCCERWACIIWR